MEIKTELNTRQNDAKLVTYRDKALRKAANRTALHVDGILFCIFIQMGFASVRPFAGLASITLARFTKSRSTRHKTCRWGNGKSFDRHFSHLNYKFETHEFRSLPWNCSRYENCRLTPFEFKMYLHPEMNVLFVGQQA